VGLGVKVRDMANLRSFSKDMRNHAMENLHILCDARKLNSGANDIHTHLR